MTDKREKEEMAEIEIALESVVWDTYLYDTVLLVRPDEDGGAAVKIPAHRLKLSFFAFFKTMFESPMGQANMVLEDNRTVVDLRDSLGTKESWLCVLRWVYTEKTFIDFGKLKVARNLLQRFCKKWFQWHALIEQEEPRDEKEATNCEKLLRAIALLGFLTSLDLDLCNLVGAELKHSKAAQWACMLAFIHTKDPRQAETQLQFSQQEFSHNNWRRAFDIVYSKFQKCEDDVERKSVLWNPEYDIDAWWKVFTDQEQQALGWLAILVFCAPTTCTLLWEPLCDKLQQPLSTPTKPNVLYMPRLYCFTSCLKTAIPCSEHLPAHAPKGALGAVLLKKMLVAREGGHFVSHIAVAKEAPERLLLLKQSIWSQAFAWLNLPVVSYWEVDGGFLSALGASLTNCWSIAARSLETGTSGSLRVFCTSCQFMKLKPGQTLKTQLLEDHGVFVPAGPMARASTTNDIRQAFEMALNERRGTYRPNQYV